MTTPMEQTESLTQNYRKRYDVLAERVEALDDEVRQLKRRRLPGIKSAVQSASQARAELAAHIEAHPELFEKPRTFVVAGIRVGVKKGSGRIEFDDKARVCKLIQKHFPEQAETLIKITEAPVKKALGTLTSAQLKKIGCQVVDTGDEVVINPVDSNVDKLVNALLAEAEDLERKAA